MGCIWYTIYIRSTFDLHLEELLGHRTLGCTSMHTPQILLKITPLIAITCHFSRPLLYNCDQSQVKVIWQVLCFPYTTFFYIILFSNKMQSTTLFQFACQVIYILKFYLFIYLNGYIVKDQNWESPSNRPSDGCDSHFICIKFTHALFPVKQMLVYKALKQRTESRWAGKY